MPLPSRADAAVLRVHSLALKKNDTVMLRPPSSDLPPFIGRVERVDPDGKAAPGELRGQPSLYLAWFYRPEEVNGGRREFHGAREVFLSDHRDWCHANSVEALCRVMSLQAYQESNVIQPNDFFCRFFYSASTATFRPDEVPVYCICDKPYNPDVFMVECGTCFDWFHPRCVQLSEEEVERMSTFKCPNCRRQDKQTPAGAGRKRMQ